MKNGDKVKTADGRYGVIKDTCFQVESEAGDIITGCESFFKTYDNPLFNVGDEVVLPTYEIATISRILLYNIIWVNTDLGGPIELPRYGVRPLKDLIEEYGIIDYFSVGRPNIKWEAHCSKKNLYTFGHTSKYSAISNLIKMIEDPEEEEFKNKLTLKESAVLSKYVDAFSKYVDEMEEASPLFLSYGKRGDWDMFDDAN